MRNNCCSEQTIIKFNTRIMMASISPTCMSRPVNRTEFLKQNTTVVKGKIW